MYNPLCNSNISIADKHTSMEPSVDNEHPAEIAIILRLQHRIKQEFMLKEFESVQKGHLRQMIDEQIKGYYSA